MTRWLTIFLLVLGVAACGVKSDLTKPGPAPTQSDERDPSKPPQPLGK